MAIPWHRRILAIRFLFAVVCVWLAALPASATTDKAIIVVIDGLRSTEGLDDPQFNYIPRIGQDLASLGSVARSCDNMGQTTTVNGHSYIGSGRYQSLPEDGTERSLFPHLWEYYRKASGDPATEALVVATKARLICLSYSRDAEYGPADSALAFAGFPEDKDAISKLVVELAVHSPKVALINLGDVDAAGHGGSWNAYTRTIEYADSLVYYLWTRVQQFPEYRDRTAFIVTSDHGRHYDAYGDWRNHGDTCPGCRRIPLIAVGPDFKVGTTSWTPCQQVDICKTVGYLLGFPTPKAGGRILNEILQVPAGVVEFLPPRNRSVIVRDGAVQILNAWDTMGTIGLFDLTGRLLYGAEMHPGGSISWQPPAAGVMFYRFRSGENSEKGKLTFIR